MLYSYSEMNSSVDCSSAPSLETYFLHYVDDITVMGNDAAHIILIKQELTKRFNLTDLGEFTYFLGIQVTRDRKNRTLELD